VDSTHFQMWCLDFATIVERNKWMYLEICFKLTTLHIIRTVRNHLLESTHFQIFSLDYAIIGNES
jgi:hypothetical protein